MNNLQTSGQLTIGTMASRTGMNVSAIRYYEEVGLIPQAARRPSGHRVYGQEVEELLMLIRHCRDFGLREYEAELDLPIWGPGVRGAAQRELAALRVGFDPQLQVTEVVSCVCVRGLETTLAERRSSPFPSGSQQRRPCPKP